MAAYYATVGAKVTVVEMLDHIAGPTDREISTRLQKELEAKGVEFLLSHACEKIEKGTVYVKAPDGQIKTIAADKVLLSIGRRANYIDIGLETIGVETERPGIKTNPMCQTNVPDVYAIGDVNGHHMLAHTAYREAEVAVNTILGKKDYMRYHANPSVIYTMPEVASVGKTEEECKEKNIPYEVQKLSMMYSGRFVAENEGADGLCNGRGFANARCLYDDIVKAFRLHQVAQLKHEVHLQRAADTTVLQCHQRFVLLVHYTAFLYQVGIDVHLADVVDDNGKAYTFFVIKDTVEQGSLAAAQVSSDE